MLKIDCLIGLSGVNAIDHFFFQPVVGCGSGKFFKVSIEGYFVGEAGELADLQQ